MCMGTSGCGSGYPHTILSALQAYASVTHGVTISLINFNIGGGGGGGGGGGEALYVWLTNFGHLMFR